MTIKEAKEIACQALGDFYTEDTGTHTRIEEVEYRLLLKINRKLKGTGFRVWRVWSTDRKSFKLILCKEECAIGKVYLKEDQNDSNS